MEPTIRERTSALSAVDRSIERALSGSGNSLFVVGEAGLGKTTILRQAKADAPGSMRILGGRGEPMETEIAFGLVNQVFPGFADDEAEEVPVDPSVPYVRLLRRVGAETESRGPLLILLDDLHWADRDSVELFAFLARRLESLPVALIGALRPWPVEASEMVRQLGPERAQAERLAPLERASIEAVIEERSGQELTAETAEHCWRMSSGNPLLAVQIAASLGGESGLPGVLDLSQASSELLLSRFTELGTDVRALAGVASVVGVTFRTEIVAEVTELDPKAIDAAFETLFRAGLVETVAPGWLRFVHPLLRQALYDDLPPRAREHIHSGVFWELVGRGFEREAAEHAVQAGMEGDLMAAEVLERVGRSALAAGAVATAARNLEAAVRFRGDLCPPELLMATVDSMIAAGRATDATGIGERLLAVEDLDPILHSDALRALAQANYLTGAVDLGDRQMSEAVELVAESDPARAIRALRAQSSIVWMAKGPRAALELAVHALELSEDAPTEVAEAALALWGHRAIEAGDPAGLESLAPIDRRIKAGDTGHLLDPAELVWAPAAIYCYSHTLKYAERLADSTDAMTRARDALEAAGAADGLATVSLFLGTHFVRQGHLDAALTEADRAEEFSDLTPYVLPIVPLVRAEAYLWKGEFDLTERHLAEARQRVTDPDAWLVRLWSGHIEALLRLWQGDLVASDLYLEAEVLADSVGMVEISSQPWEDHAVEAHLAAGRRGDAERVADLIEVRAEAIGTRWPRSIALFSRGRLKEADGSEEAGHLFREAVEALEHTDLPLHRVEAQLTYGGWLRRNGSMVESRPVLADALAAAEEWGAGYLSGVAADELRLAGGRRRRANEDRDELTPAESRVAREAAAGLTNDEIARQLHLSANTVRSHLKRVFAKLDIDSRRKLASRLEQLD